MKFKKFDIFVLALLCESLAANAAPVTWTVENAKFNDGGSFTGWFTYDASLNQVTGWNLVSGPGSLLGGDIYSSSCCGGTYRPPSDTEIRFFASDDTDLSLYFGSRLTNAGGKVSLSGGESSDFDVTRGLTGTPVVVASGPVININAAVSGYFDGVITAPVELTLNAGCYSVVDAIGKDPAAIYDALNYHSGVANDWAWQYRVVNVATSTTLLYAAAPRNESPATKYASETAASAAGLVLAESTFCVDATTTVGFVVDDNYLPDNTGGISVLVSETAPFDTVTLAAPTLTVLNESEVWAWEGDTVGDGHPVFYQTFNGNSVSPIAKIPGAQTTTAPALGAAGGKAYLATTPPNSDDRIYVYGGNAQGKPLCDLTMCARTRATPALAGDGSTLYTAWTALDGTIMYATLDGDSWSIEPVPVPKALTKPTIGPALAFYGKALHLAWVNESGESVEVESATLPLSSGSWSTKVKIIPTGTRVAPALGVLKGTACQEVLTLAVTTTKSTVDFADYDPVTSEWSVVEAPFDLPSGPFTVLTPAIGSFTFKAPDGMYINSNELVYAGGTNSNPPPPHPIHYKDRQVKNGCP